MHDTYDGEGLFKLYCGLMTFIYLGLVGLSLALPLLGVEMATEESLQFLIIGLVSFPFMLIYAYGMFLPRAKWAYVYGIVLICIGLSSCCFWPICIPLLIKFIKPETKAYFEGEPQGADGTPY